MVGLLLMLRIETPAFMRSIALRVDVGAACQAYWHGLDAMYTSGSFQRDLHAFVEAERESRGQIGTTLLSCCFRHFFTGRLAFETSRSDRERLRTVRERQLMNAPSKHGGIYSLATPEMAQAGQPEIVYGTAAKFDIGGKSIRQRNKQPRCSRRRQRFDPGA